ncbi:MAG TPA: hypothetical protein VGR29_02230 [Thermomicrobiales bacterium]|nr:hypothetical protein [Thermomicrobiales bacterium]
MQTIQQEFGDESAGTWWRGHRLALLPWITLLVVMGVAVVTYLLSNPFREEVHQGVDVLTSGDHQRIREYLRGYGAWGPVVSIFLMTAQVIFAPIPASVVQLANGVVYGPLWGTLLNIAGQMAGQCWPSGSPDHLARARWRSSSAGSMEVPSKAGSIDGAARPSL